jgi:D-glycero-alpha-D-manno-heptose-7-phosphate kinase
MIISKTPLRASFFGGGTDFRDYFEHSEEGRGAVLSTALNMHVYITVNQKFDDKIRVVYTGNELVDSVDEIKHNIIREALKFVGIEKGIEVIYMADIPLSGAGVGLASSSALTVGVLNALHAYKGEYVTPEQLAKEACYIEIERIGQQIGIQDQYAVAYGGFNRYYFNNDGTVCVTPVVGQADTVRRLKNRLMLFYTGKTRDSKKIFEEQNAIRVDKTAMLNDLVRTVDYAYTSLMEGNIDVWGTELDRTWKIKKQFASGISNSDIDLMYDKAKAAGAVGGKILGAGGGGFMLLYVPEEYQEGVKNALQEYRLVELNFDAQGSRIIFSD